LVSRVSSFTFANTGTSCSEGYASICAGKIVDRIGTRKWVLTVYTVIASFTCASTEFFPDKSRDLTIHTAFIVHNSAWDD
jgi:MFS-type transporter involved in bile tolerance (Atg22 family)